MQLRSNFLTTISVSKRLALILGFTAFFACSSKSTSKSALSSPSDPMIAQLTLSGTPKAAVASLGSTALTKELKFSDWLHTKFSFTKAGVTYNEENAALLGNIDEYPFCDFRDIGNPKSPDFIGSTSKYPGLPQFMRDWFGAAQPQKYSPQVCRACLVNPNPGPECTENFHYAEIAGRCANAGLGPDEWGCHLQYIMPAGTGHHLIMWPALPGVNMAAYEQNHGFTQNFIWDDNKDVANLKDNRDGVYVTSEQTPELSNDQKTIKWGKFQSYGTRNYPNAQNVFNGRGQYWYPNNFTATSTDNGQLYLGPFHNYGSTAIALYDDNRLGNPRLEDTSNTNPADWSSFTRVLYSPHYYGFENRETQPAKSDFPKDIQFMLMREGLRNPISTLTFSLEDYGYAMDQTGANNYGFVYFAMHSLVRTYGHGGSVCGKSNRSKYQKMFENAGNPCQNEDTNMFTIANKRWLRFGGVSHS